MARYMFTNSIIYTKEELDINISIYDRFLKFKDIFFRDGKSIFDSSIKLFDNNEVFEEFEKRIIKNYDSSKKNSVEKYTLQLKNSSKKFRHFFSNLIYLYNLPIHETYKETKINEILTYLDYSIDKSSINKLFIEDGIASYGGLKRSKYYDINFLYFFTKKYKDNLLINPNELINTLNLYELMSPLTNEKIDNRNLLPSRHMLNYLFNPDVYEPIVNTSCKENIVKYYLGKVNKNTIDEDILSIRKNKTGFEVSLFDICKKSGMSKTAYVVNLDFKQKKDDFKVSLSSKNYKEDDLVDKYKRQIENGLNAELLVYNDIIKEVDEKVLLNQLIKLISFNKIEEISDKLERLIHYSKNFDKYAPFDLISTQGQELVYIEVKSTIGNEIYFSKSELEFAYEHIENYLVKVVKDGEIYDFSLYEVICEYFELKEKINLCSIDTIKVKIGFNQEN